MSVQEVESVQSVLTRVTECESGMVIDQSVNDSTVLITTALLDSLRQWPVLTRLIVWSGHVWVDGRDYQSRRARFRNIVVRCSILLAAAYAIRTVCVSSSPDRIIIYLAFMISYLSVLPGQYYNQSRLHERVGKREHGVLRQCVRTSAYFALASGVPVIFFIVGQCLHAGPTFEKIANILFAIAQFYLVAYLAFNLLILLIDVQVASVSIDELLQQCSNKTLTLDALCCVRDDVRNRVKRSTWVTDIVLVPCLASVLSIVMIVFLLHKHQPSSTDVVTSLGYLLVFLKEVIFVAIAFYHVAKVNGKADQLTIELSRTIWCPSESWIPDMGRLSVYASSLSEPISYRLLFRRISWSDLAVNAVSFCVTLLVGFVRYLVDL